MSVRGIRKQLRELKDVKLVEVERVGLGKTNRMYLLEPQPDLLCVEKNNTGGYQPRKKFEREKEKGGVAPSPRLKSGKTKRELGEERAVTLPTTSKTPPARAKYSREELLEKLKELDRKEKANHVSLQDN
jgi:hypothetical protein